MAHYAFLDDSNIVVLVITGRNEDEVVNGISDWEKHYSEIKSMPCKRTSYNTKAGQHTSNGIPFRKNFAGIGFSYDPVRDAFIPPKDYQSWILDEETCLWIPPIPYPQDGNEYKWNEETIAWVLAG